MHATVDGIDAEFHTHICYGEVEKVYTEMIKLAGQADPPRLQEHGLCLPRPDPTSTATRRTRTSASASPTSTPASSRTWTTSRTASAARSKLLPADRLWIYPDCGLKTRTVEESEAKLKVMVDAVRDIKRELSLD